MPWRKIQQQYMTVKNHPKARNAKEKKKMVKNPNKTRLGNFTYATKVLVLECWELLDRAMFY